MMKFSTLFIKPILSLGLILTIALPLEAKKDKEKPISSHQFEIMPEVFSYSYREWSNKRPFMSDHGTLFGISGNWTYNFGRNYIKLKPRFAKGKVDYKSSSTGRLKDDPYWYVEGQAVFGHRFDFLGPAILSPYTGIGYRFLENDSANTRSTTGHYGYLRESTYLFLPIGADIHIPLDGQLSLILNGEFDLFLGGSQKSHLPGGVIDNTQKKGFGARTSAGLNMAFNSFDLELRPFFRYWTIGDSDIKCNLLICGREPKNATKEAGLGLAIKF